jgi:hypothetical protein
MSIAPLDTRNLWHEVTPQNALSTLSEPAKDVLVMFFRGYGLSFESLSGIAASECESGEHKSSVTVAYDVVAPVTFHVLVLPW